MFKLRKSVFALAGVLAMLGVIAVLTPEKGFGQNPAAPGQSKVIDANIINTTLPVTGSVSVANVVETHSALPSGAFSVMKDSQSISNSTIVGPDPEGTNYAITSLTVANPSFVSARVNLFARYGTTTNCQNFNGPPIEIVGPYVVVPAGETVHLTFPQPFILTARPGSAGCMASTTPENLFITVVGYRF